MREIGISIYPTVSSTSKIKEYIEKSASLGFTRVFTSLLYIDGDEFIAFKEVLDVARQYNMRSVVDVTPEIFRKLNIDLRDSEKLL